MINSDLVLHVCPMCFARFRSHNDLHRHERAQHPRQSLARVFRIRGRHLLQL